MVCLALPESLRIVQRGVQRAEGPLPSFLFPQDWGTKGLTLNSLDWIPAFAGMTCPPVDTDHSMACLALPVFLRVVQRGVRGPKALCVVFSSPNTGGSRGLIVLSRQEVGSQLQAVLPSLRPRMVTGGV